MNLPLALFLAGEFTAGCVAAAVVALRQARRTLDAILAEARREDRDG